MARIKSNFSDPPQKVNKQLVGRLADELKANREFGQPLVYERTYDNGRMRVLVIWDEWKDATLEQRTNIILAAIEQADGKEYRKRVALANGLTVPEGMNAGMLPYQVFPVLRKSDKVTYEQCREAMLDEGASTLFGANKLQLRFATEDEAEKCRERLVRRLPESVEIWVVTEDVLAHDPDTMDDLDD